MPFDSRRRATLITAACAGFGIAARAQGFAGKPLRVIVAGVPGGTAEIVARLVTDSLERDLGQSAFVDLKPGASGMIAVSELLQAPHDGHTLLVASSSVVCETPHTVKLKVDMRKSLWPIAELARSGLVLDANPGFPASNLKELIAWAKAHPGQGSYASYSPGTLSHVLGLVLNKEAGIDLVHVGYKGSTPALVDVVGNQVPLMFDVIGASLPLIKSGRIKALAVSTPRRSPVLPEVPTFTELGYPKLEAEGWFGLWCAPDVPAAAQQRVRAATVKALARATVRDRLLELGFEVPAPRSSAEIMRTVDADYERVGAVLASIGFKPE